MNKRIKRIAIVLTAVGTGLFLIGYNIGTGSVTTMAKAGAEHEMELFWALVLSCIFTFIMMVTYGKVTLVSGNTALFNIKNEFSRLYSDFENCRDRIIFHVPYFADSRYPLFIIKNLVRCN